MEATPSKSKQVGISFLFMGCWLVVGTLLVDHDFHPMMPVVGTFGFYFWLLTVKTDYAFPNWVEEGLPHPWDEVALITTAGVLVLVWVAILLLPLFGNWRRNWLPVMFLSSRQSTPPSRR